MRQQRHGGTSRKIHVGAGNLRVGEERTFGLEGILGGWNWQGGSGTEHFVAISKPGPFLTTHKCTNTHYLA